MKRDLTVYDMQKEFMEFDRDYYSYEGYQALFDLYNEIDEEWELDVIAICCDWTEYETGVDLANDYDNIYSLTDYFKDNESDFEGELNDDMTIAELKEEYYKALIKELENNTFIIALDNGHYLIQAF